MLFQIRLTSQLFLQQAQRKWEEMKNRVLYKGKGSNDITNLSGKRAMEAGFGIGNGLDYEEITA